MKFTFASLMLPLLATPCLSGAVDMWSSPLKSRTVAQYYEVIDSDQLKELVNKPLSEQTISDGTTGKVYFCEKENWGPPCYVYYPELEYTCEALDSELAGNIGSVFVEPGIICRLSILSSENTCSGIQFVAWPEIEGGWDDLFHREAAAGGYIGSTTTHFTCARCTNCPPGLEDVSSRRR